MAMVIGSRLGSRLNPSSHHQLRIATRQAKLPLALRGQRQTRGMLMTAQVVRTETAKAEVGSRDWNMLYRGNENARMTGRN